MGEVLSSLKKDVKNEATVLGFVGAPWTLAAYVVEGKSSKNYSLINWLHSDLIFVFNMRELVNFYAGELLSF